MSALFLLVILTALTFLVLPPYPPRGPAPAPTHSSAVDSSIAYFRKEAPQFANSCAALRSAIQAIDFQSPRSIADARQKLIDCRLHYKRIEFFLEYFFKSSSRIYNSPPKYEPEEPDMEYQSPAGLQGIESLLYDYC